MDGWCLGFKVLGFRVLGFRVFHVHPCLAKRLPIRSKSESRSRWTDIHQLQLGPRRSERGLCTMDTTTSLNLVWGTNSLYVEHR